MTVMAAPMKRRSLGKSAGRSSPAPLSVSAIGLGCMALSWGYGCPVSDSEGISLIRAALEHGITFLDTAELYGPFVNERLLAKAIADCREQVVVATKVGYKIENGKAGGLDSSPAQIRKAVEGCLRRLEVDHIDLLYQHRVDPLVPIEDTISEMSSLVGEGKVRHIGLCEVSADTIRRAHAVHPLTAVQSEYSLWERGLEASVLPTLQELGIGLVAFCPLGRGLFGGKVSDLKRLRHNDLRRDDPRFAADNLEGNSYIVEELKAIAARRQCTSAQIALAWLLAKSEFVVPIPGTTSVSHLRENAAAVTMQLTEQEMHALDALAVRRCGDRPFRNVQVHH